MTRITAVRWRLALYAITLALMILCFIMGTLGGERPVAKEAPATMSGNNI